MLRLPPRPSVALLAAALCAALLLPAAGCGRKGDPHPKSELHDSAAPAAPPGK